MYHPCAHLVMPRGHPTPTKLPAEFDNYVTVLEVIDSHFSGYVYLEIRYLLTYCPEDEKYNYVKYEFDRRMCMSFRTFGKNIITHGPAVFIDKSHTTDLSIDSVHCLRCLSWPHQAADWPARQRNYDWPDSATVERVVSNGCDVVQAAHRQYRQDELISKAQWRLSFSRAEIVLVNSWMPVQQIVYHMLRFFVKTERLTKGTDNSNAETLSNYHIKTLMLWACELKSRSWWTGSLNLVKICVKLLHTVSVSLTEKCCQHHFINDCRISLRCMRNFKKWFQRRIDGRFDGGTWI